MELLIAYLNDGHNITDLLYSILVIAAIIVCVEKFIKWIYDLFIKMYKRKRGQEDENTTIVKNTEQIKNLATAIDNLADLLNKQYQHLDKKIDEQKERITKIDEEGKNCFFDILAKTIKQGQKEGDILAGNEKELAHLYIYFFKGIYYKNTNTKGEIEIPSLDVVSYLYKKNRY